MTNLPIMEVFEFCFVGFVKNELLNVKVEFFFLSLHVLMAFVFG